MEEGDSSAGVQELINLIRYENLNLDVVLGDEPSLDRALIYLSMALAYDMMDRTEPEAVMNSLKASVVQIAGYAHILEDDWFPENGTLAFDGPLDLNEEEWNSLFSKAETLRQELLSQHLSSYGGEDEESFQKAYAQTTTCIVYMIAIGCARSTNVDDASEFACNQMTKALNDLLAKLPEE